MRAPISSLRDRKPHHEACWMLSTKAASRITGNCFSHCSEFKPALASSRCARGGHDLCKGQKGATGARVGSGYPSEGHPGLLSAPWSRGETRRRRREILLLRPDANAVTAISWRRKGTKDAGRRWVHHQISEAVENLLHLAVSAIVL